MQNIPYELLQHIASWLLPRYQCRLALASKHCYRYLYTDLLRWHARKNIIHVPRYIISENTFNMRITTSILETENDTRIFYSLYGSRIAFINLTKNTTLEICDGMLRNLIFDVITYYCIANGLKALNAFKRNLSKEMLLALENIKQPIFLLNDITYQHIDGYLFGVDRENFTKINPYLTFFTRPLFL